MRSRRIRTWRREEEVTKRSKKKGGREPEDKRGGVGVSTFILH